MKRSSELIARISLAAGLSLGITACGGSNSQPVEHEVSTVDCKIQPSAIATVVFNPKNHILDYLGDAVKGADGQLEWKDKTMVETFPSKKYFVVAADGFGPTYPYTSTAEPESVAFSDSQNGSRVTVQQLAPNTTNNTATDIVRYYC